MAVLCVDAGTTMVKAVMFDDDGRELAVARQATRVDRRAPGSSEQDMYSVWDAVVFTVRSVVHGVTEPVRMLSITAQGDGCWLVGRDGRPTGPAILWNDGRAGGIVDGWDAAGVLADAFRINGNLGFAGTSGAILKWLRENDRQRLTDSYRVLHCNGWLFLKFTGEYAMDLSDAASPFLDAATRRYSPELMDLYGMPWVTDLLPDVRRDDDRVGVLQDVAAAELRLPAGLPVVMAPFDIPSTAIGIGAIEAGQACTVLGTTLSTGVVAATADTSGTAAGMTLPSGVGETSLRVLAAMSGVETISWGMGIMGLDNPNWLSDLAATTRAGADGVVFHPYLSPAGERAPFRDSRARGTISGLSFEHTRSHLARAMLEGLSFVVRDCLTATSAPATELRLTGGGANSTFWCQLLADVTGVPTSRSVDSEIGAKGAFITALVATGVETDVAAAVNRYVFVRDTFESDASCAGVYDELFEDFTAIRDSSSGNWPRLAELRARRQSGVVADDADDDVLAQLQ